MGLLFGFKKVKSQTATLQNRLVMSAKPFCKVCKTVLQTLQDGFAGI